MDEVGSAALELSPEAPEPRVMELPGQRPDREPVHGPERRRLVPRDIRRKPLEREFRIQVAREDMDRVAPGVEPRGDLGHVPFDAARARGKTGRDLGEPHEPTAPERGAESLRAYFLKTSVARAIASTLTYSLAWWESSSSPAPKITTRGFTWE